MTKTKVFVGNLSFKTTEADLRKEFEVAGKVESANVITRGARSLGYGFVEMGSLEEANKSVELLHKKLVDQREINVEVARPREDKPAPAPKQPRQPQQAGDAAVGSPNAAAGEGRPRARNSRRGRGRGPARNPADGSASPSQAGAVTGEARPPRAPRAPRAPRPPRSDQPRTPSKNTLYVSNLPFSVDDAKLSEIFAGLNIKQAHVVRKPNERSKGFGFVEFNNEEDQVKALNAIGKKTVEGRELTVKIALTELPKADQAAVAAATGAPAPAAGSASPAPAAAAPAAEQK